MSNYDDQMIRDAQEIDDDDLGYYGIMRYLIHRGVRHLCRTDPEFKKIVASRNPIEQLPEAPDFPAINDPANSNENEFNRNQR